MGVKSFLVSGAGLVATAAAAAAVNTPPTLPVNSQIGAFNLPLQCTLNGKAVAVNALITATAPVVANPGQTVYLNDATAQITVPGSAVPAGVSTANILATAALGISNGSPASLSVFPGGSMWVNGTKATAGKPLVVNFPTAGTLASIGPITAGSAGVTKLTLGALSAQVYAYNAKGAQVGSPLSFSCPATTPPTFLANMNIQGSANKTVNSPSNGFATKFPAIPAGSEFGFFHTTYSCDFLGFTIPVDLKFGGLAKSSYAQGSTFYLGNITSYLNIAQVWINAAHSLYGAQTFVTTVNQVLVNVTNATPSSVNAITTPITTTSQYQTSGGLNISFPASGFLKAGPFQATGGSGNYMSLYLTSSVAQTVIYNSAGKQTKNGTVTCNPTGTLDLYSLLIS